MSVKIQVVFYSMYGHIYKMAEAVAEGARSVGGTEVRMLQVPELVPDAALERTGALAARGAFKHVPIAQTSELADADAIIFGTPTRFGNMCSQMRNFLDQTGGLWAKGGLIGKVVASSPALVRSMVARKRRSPVFIQPCYIMA